MRQVTIRGLDQDVAKAIRKMASDKGKSINQVIKEIIHKEFKKKQGNGLVLKRVGRGLGPAGSG